MILITGGSGLVGSHLVTELLAQGFQVRVLVRSGESKNWIRKVMGYYMPDPDNALKKVEWANGDILDKVSLAEALQGVDYVFHCAAVVSFSRSDRKYMLDVNIRGTANLVDACLAAGIKKLVHLSSIAAIKAGLPGTFAIESNGWPEGHKLNYAYSKTQGEFEVWRGITEGLNAVILNPSVILGPGNWKSGSPKFFSTVYKRLKFYTRGVTGFVDVCDVVKVMVMFMQNNIHSQRYIVSAENLSYQQLFTAIALSLGVKPPSVYAAPALTRLAVYAGMVKSALFFSPPLITAETERSAHKVNHYSSDKLIGDTGFTFLPVESSIERIAKLFISDKKL
ncbi:MAG: NAD-dependent epimerase/dehydratase family protein [Bacteroidales bacterium]|nr:NAD-dependent epimerase/dehydratase family protein [Bacteroidales bacterium]